MTYFTEWDAPEGHFKAGSIKRASSSNDKVWAETNKTNVDLLAGTFVAVNAAGGIKRIAADTDVVHGIVMRTVFGDSIPHTEQTDVGHFSHGDEVVALCDDDAEFTRGSKVYIVATDGVDAGKITNVAVGNIATNYYVTELSTGNKTAAITLGFAQAVTAAAQVSVTGVTVSPSTASIAVGATQQLTPTVAPANASNNSVTYASSDTEKATVSASGLVTGVAEGSATITVTTVDGEKTATCAVTVTAVQGG
jgi:hypothetical protein